MIRIPSGKLPLNSSDLLNPIILSAIVSIPFMFFQSIEDNFNLQNYSFYFKFCNSILFLLFDIQSLNISLIPSCKCFVNSSLLSILAVSFLIQVMASLTYSFLRIPFFVSLYFVLGSEGVPRGLLGGC